MQQFLAQHDRYCQCSFDHKQFKIIKYMGTKYLNTEKFEYIWENMDHLPTMEAGSIIFLSTV
jgi:hypothetical protein